MIEHEKKFCLLKDLASFRDRVSKLGFASDQESYQKDAYFSRPDVDFMETKECLRIRVEVNHTEVTYKPPTTKSMALSQAIWKKEINLTVEDESVAREFLLALGCVELCTVEKKRELFKKGNVTVSIDHITDLGDYVEIEIIAQEESSALIDEINKVASELGLSDSEVVRLPYRDLIMNKIV